MRCVGFDSFWLYSFVVCQVEEEAALEYAKTVGAQHIYCSAKTGKGVEVVFLELTKEVMKAGQDPERHKEESKFGGKRTHISITTEEPEPSGCCGR